MKSTIKRGQKFFPGLSGMARKLGEITEQVTDRGLTGPAARDAEDAQARIAKRQAKLARRAKRAQPSECLDCAHNPGLCDTHNSEDKT